VLVLRHLTMRYWSQRRTAAPLKPIPTETAVKRVSVLDRPRRRRDETGGLFLYGPTPDANPLVVGRRSEALAASVLLTAQKAAYGDDERRDPANCHPVANNWVAKSVAILTRLRLLGWGPRLGSTQGIQNGLTALKFRLSGSRPISFNCSSVSSRLAGRQRIKWTSNHS
jgi:hypothetical protein